MSRFTFSVYMSIDEVANSPRPGESFRIGRRVIRPLGDDRYEVEYEVSTPQDDPGQLRPPSRPSPTRVSS